MRQDTMASDSCNHNQSSATTMSLTELKQTESALPPLNMIRNPMLPTSDGKNTLRRMYESKSKAFVHTFGTGLEALLTAILQRATSRSSPTIPIATIVEQSRNANQSKAFIDDALTFVTSSHATVMSTVSVCWCQQLSHHDVEALVA